MEMDVFLIENLPPLSDENTRSKFLFYGGQNCLSPDVGLERYIPSEIIPDFLGGPCAVSWVLRV